MMRVIANPAKSIAEIEIMTRATGEACIDSINFFFLLSRFALHRFYINLTQNSRPWMNFMTKLSDFSLFLS
ncbi:MAG: hypothetical protein ACLTBF_09845, partial [Christensenellales bacterium]